MRLGLLTTSFPRFTGDVAGHFVRGFADALARRGHRVTVLAPEPAEPLAPPRFADLELVWVPHLRPRALQRSFYGAGVPDNVARDPLAALGLLPFTLQLWREAAQRAGGWDAVISHWALPSALVASLLPARPRHLAVLHSADVHALSRVPAGGLLARRIAEGADQLLFVSRALRQQFLQRLGAAQATRVTGRCHVSPMGVEPFEAPPPTRRDARRALGLGPGRVLLSLGRLVPVKGLDVLLHAVRTLPEVRLVVAGEGPELSRLRALAGDNVRFVGVVTGADKQRWLAAADAFVLPSRTLPGGRGEGTPTTLLEAMQAGLPVIASAVGGVPEVVTHGQEGWLVETHTPAHWRTALEHALADTRRLRRLGQRARRRARDFQWTRIAPHLEVLLSGDDVACEQSRR